MSLGTQCYIHHSAFLYICKNEDCILNNDSMLCQKCYESNDHLNCKIWDQVQPIQINQFKDNFQENILQWNTSIKQQPEKMKKLENFNFQSTKNCQDKKGNYLQINNDDHSDLDYKNSQNLLRSMLNYYHQKDFSKSKILPMAEKFKKIGAQVQQMREIWIENQQKPKHFESQINQTTRLSPSSISSQKQNKQTEKMMEVIYKQEIETSELVQQQQQIINNQIDNQEDQQNILSQTNLQQNLKLQEESIQANIPQFQNINSQNEQKLDFQSEQQLETNQENLTSNQEQIQNENQSEKKKNNVAYRKLDTIEILNNPIVKIEIIDKKILICLDSSNYIGLINDYKFKKSQNNKLVRQFQQKILDIQITEDKQILVHTVTGLLLLNYSLNTLCEWNQKLENNLLITYPMTKIQDIETNTICYLKDSKNLIGIQIRNNQIKQQFKQVLQLCEVQVLSIQVIKNNLFIGFQNGEIVLYELQRLTLKTTYKIGNSLSNKFQIILFEENFCLGIQENILYRLNYGSSPTTICSLDSKIISCSYYDNQKEDKFHIHLLQENNNIFVYSEHKKQNPSSSKRLLKGRTCLKLYQDSKVYYGNKKGKVTIYHL